MVIKAGMLVLLRLNKCKKLFNFIKNLIRLRLIYTSSVVLNNYNTGLNDIITSSLIKTSLKIINERLKSCLSKLQFYCTGCSAKMSTSLPRNLVKILK